MKDKSKLFKDSKTATVIDSSSNDPTLIQQEEMPLSKTMKQNNTTARNKNASFKRSMFD